MTSRWLVTGADGFLGSNLGRVLGERFHLIAGTRRAVTPPGFASSVTLDLVDSASIRDAIATLRPDVVINAAAIADHEACITDPELAHRVNAEAVGELSDACLEVGAAFVQISTDAVFDGSRGHYGESDEPSPFSVYGESKLLGERAALDAGPALIVRTNFFGWSPSGTRSILEFFVNSLTTGSHVRGYTDFIVTSLYAADLVEAIEALVDSRARGVFHVASRDALSKYDFGCLVSEVFGLDSSLITPASAASGSHGASRVRDLSLDCSLASEWLGRALPSQREGIDRAAHDRLR